MWKKNLCCSFAKYKFFELPEKPPHASINVFVIYGHFCEIEVFLLGIFSIRNFDLLNLKANGNASIYNC